MSTMCPDKQPAGRPASATAQPSKSCSFNLQEPLCVLNQAARSRPAAGLSPRWSMRRPTSLPYTLTGTLQQGPQLLCLVLLAQELSSRSTLCPERHKGVRSLLPSPSSCLYLLLLQLTLPDVAAAPQKSPPAPVSCKGTARSRHAGPCLLMPPSVAAIAP